MSVEILLWSILLIISVCPLFCSCRDFFLFLHKPDYSHSRMSRLEINSWGSTSWNVFYIIMCILFKKRKKCLNHKNEPFIYVKMLNLTSRQRETLDKQHEQVCVRDAAILRIVCLNPAKEMCLCMWCKPFSFRPEEVGTVHINLPFHSPQSAIIWGQDRHPTTTTTHTHASMLAHILCSIS